MPGHIDREVVSCTESTVFNALSAIHVYSRAGRALNSLREGRISLEARFPINNSTPPTRQFTIVSGQICDFVGSYRAAREPLPYREEGTVSRRSRARILYNNRRARIYRAIFRLSLSLRPLFELFTSPRAHVRMLGAVTASGESKQHSAHRTRVYSVQARPRNFSFIAHSLPRTSAKNTTYISTRTGAHVLFLFIHLFVHSRAAAMSRITALGLLAGGRGLTGRR